MRRDSYWSQNNNITTLKKPHEHVIQNKPMGGFCDLNDFFPKDFS